jgi:hypothetical protein
MHWNVSCLSAFAVLLTGLPSAGRVEADLPTKVTKTTKKCFLEVFLRELRALRGLDPVFVV